MPTILERLEARRAERLTAHDTAQRAIDELIAQVDANPDQRDLTPDQDTKLTELISQRDAHLDGTDEDPGLRALDARIAQLQANADVSAQAGARITQLSRNGGPSVTVGRNEQIYRRGGEHSFFADMYSRDFMRDAAAAERLDRHQSELLERRDLTVSAVAGLIPPVFLVDEYAALARAGRPFLNSLQAKPLPPEGISFTIPRVTTGSAAAMTAEGAGWNEQDVVGTNLTRSVELVTAQQDLSRTMFQRGGAMLDDILFADLMAGAELALNVSTVSGSGTSPQHLGILSVAGINVVAYTDVTPTVGEFWPKLADAVQRVNSLRFAPATVVYMHPRRWGWINSAVDSTGRPLFDFSKTVPTAIIGLGDAAAYGQVVGTLMGLPVVTDASIPTNLGAGTNEDIVIVARSSDLLYWEDPMMQFTMEQALASSPAQVRLAVGRFALAAFGRYPVGISTVGGTGLVPPTF